MNYIKNYNLFISESKILDPYLIKESQDTKNNIKEIVKIVKETGLKDSNAIMGLLSVIGKESGFTIVRETGKNLKNDENWLRKKFPALKDYAGDIITLKNNREKDFYNLVYGPDTKAGKALGNTEDGDGYKYRGGGYTQLTGKKYYNYMGLNDPKEIETPQGAAKALKNSIKSYVGNNPQSLKFSTPDEGVKYFVNKVRGGSSTFEDEYKKASKTLNTFFKSGNKFSLPV